MPHAAIYRRSMKKDPLHQYQSVRKALEKEMNQLRSRLAEIASALGKTVSEALAPAKPQRRGNRVVKRAKNQMSLKEALLKVTATKPLTKQEILKALDKEGYKFTALNPLNSVNTQIYGPKAPLEKKGNKKFGPRKK